ncbi:TRAP transporter small permease [Amphritea sp. 2_MG-2023]|jgi:TRAP-type C4-dicarboxylate transport system permease small subunit|uniref:TRAP transporter small permease n=1 Tax=Amphritea TaxID=515417 RepID=UPI001C06EF0D|nr:MULTISPECIES: TRAP transporter small permease [Amphritea]MBU2965798.1 TRAP transporter small permease [Amphritea atlantica]MDO6417354.1 TRAP transporter small permease [Amphritea sp. 2_MG-2023]MDX2424497.1 TRAP transporter small permease [Amphritea sp.]
MSLLCRLNRLQLKGQAVLMVLASVFIVLGVSAMAIMRYVFESNLYGAEEIILISAFWIYFLGAGHASYQRKHICAEVFSVYCRSETIKSAVKVLAETITLGLAALYTYWAVEFVSRSFLEGGVTPVWRIPLVVVHVSILIGFILIALYSVRDLKHTLKKIRS